METLLHPSDRPAHKESEDELTPEVMEAGVKIFYAWQNGDWEFEDFEGYGKPIGAEGPVQTLVRAMWFAMRSAHLSKEQSEKR